MKRKLVIAAIGLAFCGFALAQVVQQVQHPYAKQLEITLRLEHSDYLAMEPVLCSITIKNTGKTPVTGFFSQFGAGEPYVFIVKTQKGRQMPETAYNKTYVSQVEKDKKRAFSGSSPDSLDLAPGQSSIAHFAINQFVDLTEAGSSLDWRDAGAGDNSNFTAYVERFGARSNTVTFSCRGDLFDINDPSLQTFFERRKARENKE